MKRTISAAVGGRNFILEEDAYRVLDTYLENFKNSLKSDESLQCSSTEEIMEELEMRISELITEKLKGREVADSIIIREIVRQLGMPYSAREAADDNPVYEKEESGSKKLFRDTDNKVLFGVCSGVGEFFGIDPVLVRIMFILMFFFGSAGFWIYIIMAIIVPPAKTATEKCRMKGIPATADNIRRFSKKRE